MMSLSLSAQNNHLSTKVTLKYEKVRLEQVLNALTQTYGFHFSYSTDLVNVRQKVSVSAENVDLRTALETMLRETTIDFLQVGNHIVLRNNPNKKPSSKNGGLQGKKSNHKNELPVPEKSDTSQINVPEPENSNSGSPVILLDLPQTREVRTSGNLFTLDESLLKLDWLILATEWNLDRENKKRLLQLTLIPGISTSKTDSEDFTNVASLNLLYGKNGGVEGFEFGGLHNTISKDVKGAQVAGISNHVAGNVRGTQVAGILNKSGGFVHGVQLGGLYNEAFTMQGMQISGVANRTIADADGMQISGLFNLSGDNSTKLQASGIINLTRNTANLQLSGLVNVADKVETGQVSTLFNLAKEVKGFQLGLINKSDTVSGVSVGLLNLVKRGYNNVELYAGEGLHGNLLLRLGSNSFYNIFHIGARYPQGDTNLWGFGYGIGSRFALGSTRSFNFELLAIHINEVKNFTRTLNSIGQMRLIWNYQVARNIALFFGPTANMMISRLKNDEKGTIGSSIVPYSIFTVKPDDDTNIQTWIGVNAGFRF
jgi:hypothetical protein